MKTGTSPEGQTTNLTGTPPNPNPDPAEAGNGAGAGGNTHDEHLAKAIAERDAAKAKNRELLEQLQGFESTAKDEKLKAALAEGKIDEFVTLMQGQMQTLHQENLGMRKQLEESNRLDRRRAIAEVVVRDANQQKRGAVQDILDGWIARGEVKLDAEDPNAEGERIRKKLGEKYPEYFAPADGTPVAGQPGSGKRPPPKGMIFPDLPPEEQRRLLEDDEAMKEFIEQSRGQSTALLGRSL